jgi:type IX secretion system PorP/SprF family membrane protein
MLQKFTIKTLLVAIGCVLTLTTIQAQEIVFAQYTYSPMHTNPALTGIFDGQYRFNSNYRQQWGGAFGDVPIRSIHAGFDYRVNVANKDYFSFGINAINDETGSAARVRTNKGNLSLGYLKQLGDSRYSGVSQYLSAGAQVGIGQNFANLNGVWFDRQYDSVNLVANTSLASGELIPQSASYLDYNLGIFFYNIWSEKRSFYVGASMHHLSQPNISFMGDLKENLRRRMTFHTGGELPIGQNLSVLPNAMMTIQGPAMTSSFGGQVRYANIGGDGDAAVRAGIQGRLSNRYVSGIDKEGKSVQVGTGIHTDAISIIGTLELNRLLIGASYDIHTSTIRTPTFSRGAWELSLIYTGAERRRVKTECPRF